MKPSQYLAIAVRIFSVVLFLYGVRQLPFLIGLVVGAPSGPGISWGFALLSTVLPMIIAVFLWYFPLMVAKAIIKSELDQPLEPIGLQSLLTVLILAIALYTLYYAIVSSVYWALVWHMAERNASSGGSLYLGLDSKANMIATAVELLASIFILVKARSLAFHMLHIAK